MNLFAFFKVKNHGSAKKVRRPSEFLRIFQSQKCDFLQIVHSSKFSFPWQGQKPDFEDFDVKSMKINENP